MSETELLVRFEPSLLTEARRAADSEGVSIDELINVALAQRLEVLRADAFFAERRARANPKRALEILRRARAEGRGEPPRPGDELPPGFDADAWARGGPAPR